MVDAEHAVLAEGRGHRVIDLTRALQVVADRLLQHHAALRTGRAGRLQRRADRREQAGREGQVEHRQLSPAHGRGQAGGAVGLGDVGGAVVQPRGEAAPGGLVERRRRGAVGDRGLHRLDEPLAAQLGAGRAEHLHPRRQQPVRVEEIQRGEQHPLGEVARGAEDDEEVRLARCRHGGPVSVRPPRWRGLSRCPALSTDAASIRAP